MKPEEYFCVKLNHLEFVFLTLHRRLSSLVPVNSMILAKDLFFKVEFPPCTSNFESQNKLKSPALIRWVFFICIKLFQ